MVGIAPLKPRKRAYGESVSAAAAVAVVVMVEAAVVIVVAVLVGEEGQGGIGREDTSSSNRCGSGHK